MSGISVVITTFNSEKTIAECLDAVMNLKWPYPIEVIVVDDGSFDNTIEIVNQYKELKLIKLSHGRAARATNAGIKSSTYNTIFSIDSDAIVSKNWLIEVMPALEDPQVGAAAAIAVPANKTIIGRLEGYEVEDRLYKMGYYTNHLYTMNTVYKKDVLKEIGMFDETLLGGHDADISRKIVDKGYKLVLVNKPLCKHYWRDNLAAYVKKQKHYAKTRMIYLAEKHKKANDKFANKFLILQVPLTGILVLLSLFFSVYLFNLKPMLLVLGLILMHAPRAISILLRKKDYIVIFLPVLLFARNIVWNLVVLRNLQNYIKIKQHS